MADGYIIESEVVKAKLKVNESIIGSGCLLEQLTTFLIHIVVVEIQTEKMLVLVETLNS